MPVAGTVRSAVLVLACAAALVSCGAVEDSPPARTTGSEAAVPGLSPSGSPLPRASGSVHRLGLRDHGVTVRMAVGDRLVLELSNNRLAARWAVADYPRDALVSDLKASPVSGFAFLARGPGSGPLVLTRASCGVAGTEPCPSNARVAATTWTVTVTVRAR